MRIQQLICHFLLVPTKGTGNQIWLPNIWEKKKINKEGIVLISNTDATIISIRSQQETHVNRLTDNGGNNNNDHHNKNDPHLSEQNRNKCQISKQWKEHEEISKVANFYTANVLGWDFMAV